jgi:hypothetical protein
MKMMRVIQTLTLCLAMVALFACADVTDTTPTADVNSDTNLSTTDTISDDSSTPSADASADTKINEDTTTQTLPDAHTGKPDVVQPNQGLICPGIVSCLDAAITACGTCPPNDQPCQQALQACQQAGLQACTAQAKTPNEGQLFGAMLNCQMTCAQQGGGQMTKGVMQCIREQCTDEQATCYSGNVYGGGNCAGVDTCAKGCNPMDTTGECLRGCMQAASEEAVTLWWDVQVCAQVACFEMLNNASAAQQCMNESLQPGGACNDVATQCLGGGI